MRRTLAVICFSSIYILLNGFCSSGVLATPPATGCEPTGTPTDDVISCQETDLVGVAAGRGDDRITILPDSIVVRLAFDPDPNTVAIDGGDGNDTIVNIGTVIAEVNSLGGVLESMPPFWRFDAVEMEVATAVGISGGRGSDNILNIGTVAAVSSMISAGGSTGPGISGAAAGASDALAGSTGINGDSGDDYILNLGTVTAVSGATVLKGEISVGAESSASGNSSTAEAAATGIGGGAGADDIVNEGNVTAFASALIATASGPGETDPAFASSPESGNTAEAAATGISGGAGDDNIDNRGDILAVANAVSGSVALSVDSTGAPRADTTSTAKSSATGIGAGAGDDQVSSEEGVTALATSIAAAQGAAVSDSGGAPLFGSSWKGGASAESSAAGISTGGGDDSITNDGGIMAAATSLAGTSTAAISVSNTASTSSTAKATAKAIGVHAGGGNDTLTNNGDVLAVSTATANALDFSFSQDSAAKSAHEGGATAEAVSIGISADGPEEGENAKRNLSILIQGLPIFDNFVDFPPTNNDTITNTGSLTSVANAISGAESAAISIAGAGTSNTSSKARATAIGIDAGPGSDVVGNSGEVTAVASAIAGAIGVGFSESGNAVIKGGPEAEASALGISGDGAPSNEAAETTLALSLFRNSTSQDRDQTQARGADTINNTGNVTAVAAAISGSEGGSVSISGAASADVTSKATSKAVAIDAGAGNDSVTSTGALTAVSTAIAGTAGISFSESGKSEAKAGATAEAEAYGIRADGTGTSRSNEATLALGRDRLLGRFRHEKLGASGEDVITNDGPVTAVATALSGSGSAGVSISEAASADTTSTATSRAIGIDAGGGDDAITNRGALTSVSTATAMSIGASFSQSKDSAAKVATASEASAVGISGDGALGSSLAAGTVSIFPNRLNLSARYEKNSATGADTITNDSAITAVATALSGSASGGISIDGAASLDATSKATSTAVAIDAGAGDDNVTNNGVLTAVSTAVAGTVGVSFSESGKSEAKVGAAAEAEAFGIRGDGTEASSAIGATLSMGRDRVRAGVQYENKGASGADSITNDGVATVVANAFSGSETVAASVKEASSADASSTAMSRAVGIDAGAGDDTVVNRGALTAVSTSTALTLGVGISESKAGAASAATTAEADAIGISGDGALGSSLAQGSILIAPGSLDLSARYARTGAAGADDITNDSAVTVVASALSGSASLGASIKGAASADATSTAKATAIAIDAGGGGDSVTNNGVLTAAAIATAGELGVGISGKGSATSLKSIWQGGSVAEATAKGIAGDGTDRDFSAEASLHVDTEDFRVSADGKVSQVQAGGDDTITNNGVVTATALATTPSVDVTVALDGMAASVTTSEARADATAIDGGTGDDTIINRGVLVATAVANAATANVAVSPKGSAVAADSVWDGGTTADAVAVGISGDGEGRDWSAEGSIVATEDAVQVGAAFSSTTVSGDDDINNDGTVVVTSAALTPTATVAVPVKGAGAAISASTATSTAVAIDAGSGDDIVLNQGELVSTSIAVAAAANVAVSKDAALAGNNVWDGGTTAEATAVGISGDGQGRDFMLSGSIAVTPESVSIAGKQSSTVVAGEDTITNKGTVVATAFAEVPSLSVSVTSKGVAAAVSTATARAQAVGIDAGAGDDEVSNSASVTATAVANANVLNVAVTSAGVAVAADSVWDGGATAEAEAVGIDGDGEGEDVVSKGLIKADDESVLLASERSYTTVTGDDVITNDGVVTATSLAATTSLGVAVTPSGGLSAAVTAANAKSKAAAIEAGSGDDTVDNNGVLTATSVALAASASVAYVSGGVAVAGNSVWDGGTTAVAEAIGIDGDGEGRDLNVKGEAEVADGDVRISSELSDKTVSGEDVITNTGVVTASSFASSSSAGVAVTLSGGVSAAVSTSTSKARAAGIDGGSGNDDIDNTGPVTATAVANANALTVSYATAGVAIAADAVMDGGTTAEAEAIGIDGDGEGRDLTMEGLIEVTDAGTSISGRVADETVAGDDTITNDSFVTATAVALAPSLGVAVTPGGLSVAVTTASAKARAAALDAGSGDDKVDNTGTLTATAVAASAAVPIAVTPAGVAVAADAVWDGGTKAEAEAVGISGDGTGMDFASEFSISASDEGASIHAQDSSNAIRGDDEITNEGRITATAVAESLSVAVSVTPAGLAVATATSTAKSRAAAIDAGSGDDTIDNTGELVAVSVANANAVSVSVTPAGVAVASDAVWDGGTTAEADAVGIAGDGEGRDDTTEFVATADSTAINVRGSDRSEVVSGDDKITNSGDVTATSVAVAPSIGVSVVPAGVSAALSTASTSARAAAINSGAGDDFIDNTGALAATSTAVSVAIPVAVTPAGVAIAADAIWDGGTSAEAEAIGISGDGVGTDYATEFDIDVDESGIRAGTLDTAQVVSGNDTILNDNQVSATAVAVATSIGVSVTPAGVSASASTATAKTRAAAIDAGDGNDIVENDGHLTANATSVAVAVPVAVAPVGFAVAADAVWDGGTTAQAEAVGIDGDGIGTNFSTENTLESGLDGTLVSRQVNGDSVGGRDRIVNTGQVDATAVAVAPSVAFSLGVVGGVSAANSTSQAYAAGIDAGAGRDNVLNQGNITANSVANADGVAISLGALAVSGNAVWDGGITAQSEAIGISGDGRGGNTSTEFAIESDGVENRMSRVRSTHNVAGNDRITNQAQIDADAEAVAVSVAVASGAITAAVSTSTANARAASIDAGAGNDVVDNSGALTADADATSVTTNVSWSAGVAAALDAVWDGGTTAEAEAVGIAGDGQGTIETTQYDAEATAGAVTVSEHTESGSLYGNDDIHNTGTIDATATAKAVSVSAALSSFGSVAAATSTARSRAAGIEAGGGDDTVVNEAALSAAANSVAVTTGVAVSVTGVSASLDAVWDGGTAAEANVVGIDGDGQSGNVTTDRMIEVSADGVDITEETVRESTDGDDSITNLAAISSAASANSTSVNVTSTVIGVAAAISTSTAKAESTAIRAGGGDDAVRNQGALTATSMADADGVSVSVTGVGAAASTDAFWDGGTTAEAVSIGIDGGEGDDTIDNEAAINAVSVADAASTGVAVTVGGIASAISTSTADARAAAIAGVDGDDIIRSSGDLLSASSATARGTSVSVGFAGFASADSSTIADARAVGIDTGNGVDDASNTGNIVAVAQAVAVGADVTAELLGAGFSDSLFEGETRADALAAGLVGGDGIDSLANDGIIALGSNAEISAVSISVDLDGFSAADSSATASAGSTGMTGGAAADELNNRGVIVASAMSTSLGRSVSAQLEGASTADASTTAIAVATGLDGGTGDDGLHNSGVVVLSAEADAQAKSLDITLAGAGDANANANAIAHATGMDGGEGDDLVVNTGYIQTQAAANADVSSSAWSLGGASSQQGLVDANADSTGIAGGDGSDTLFNNGGIDVDVSSTMLAEGLTTVIFGSGSGNASLNATISATGIGGGQDDDRILNAGFVSVDSYLNASSTGTAWNLIGSGDASAGIVGSTSSTGLVGGDGDDVIKNMSDVQVNALSDLDTTTSAFAFLGGASGSASLVALAEATGLAGGSGADRIFNDGSIGIGAIAVNKATGGAKSTIGGADSAISVMSRSTATGIDAGEDEDYVANLGDITVSSIASSTSLNNTSAGGAFVNSFAYSSSGSTAVATAVDLGAGNNVLLNRGAMSSTADGISQALAISSGGSHLGVDVDAFAYAISKVDDSQAIGFSGLDDANLIDSRANLDVAATPAAIAYANANGQSVVSGDGSAYSIASADDVEASGISVGAGDNRIRNNGAIAVRAAPFARSTSVSDADGVSPLSQPDSKAWTAASANGVKAVGIQAGDGDNWILNEGLLDVTAAPRVDKALADADYGNDTLGIDSFATASANVDNTQALGISVGHGENNIWNTGTITAAASPRAVAEAIAKGVGFDGDATASATAYAENVQAVGIVTGDGDNTIVNDGQIDVTANPVATATASASTGGEHTIEEVVDSDGVSSFFFGLLEVVVDTTTELVDPGEVSQSSLTSVAGAEAVGVWTGAGEDVIVNNGSIATSVIANGMNSLGTAIRSGAGDDTVVLTDGSLLAGDIELENDDDSLYLLGTPLITGDVFGGSGLDALLVDGSSQLFGDVYGFESLTLFGSSSLTVNSLTPVNELALYEGTLNVLDDYTMPSTGTLSVEVNSDGSHGQLAATGDIALDGALQVTRNLGGYVDGTKYDVVSANSVTGSFASQSLPAPTPLVSFTTEQSDNAVNVVADVLPFTTVAHSPFETAVATYLDAILPESTGDLSDALGVIQALPEEDFAVAFQSLNPDRLDTYQAANSAMRNHVVSMRNRMSGIRAAFSEDRGDEHSAFLSDREALSVRAVNLDKQSGDRTLQPFDAWVVGFSGSGGDDDGRGSVEGSGFNTSGVNVGIDFAVNDNLVAGASFGSAFAESGVPEDNSQGETGSRVTSLYATYLPTESTYVASTLSYSKNDFANRRELELGSLRRDAIRYHQSEMVSALVETGKKLETGRLNTEVFSAVNYSSLSQGGIEETGAGDVGIEVDKRQYSTLSTELGLRGSIDIETGNGVLTPQLNISVKRNFDFGDDSLSARFVGVSDKSFSATADTIPEYGVRVGLGVNFAAENGWTVQGRLDGEFDGRQNDVSGMLQIGLRF